VAETECGGNLPHSLSLPLPQKTREEEEENEEEEEIFAERADSWLYSYGATRPIFPLCQFSDMHVSCVTEPTRQFHTSPLPFRFVEPHISGGPKKRLET
jgi:hypothetical protein